MIKIDDTSGSTEIISAATVSFLYLKSPNDRATDNYPFYWKKILFFFYKKIIH